MIQPNIPLAIQTTSPAIIKKFAFLHERRKREAEGLAIVLDHFANDVDGAKASFYQMDISEASSYDYSQRIPFFLNFVKYQDEIDLDIFLTFKKYLAGRSDYKPSTKNKYLTSARIFLKELARQGFVQDVTVNVKGFRINHQQHKRPGHDEKEIESITKMIGQLKNTVFNARLRAIYHLLVLQGLRQIEVVRLDVESIDLQNRFAFVHGKGRDDFEKIVLHPMTIQSLSNYLQLVGIKSGAMFKSLGNRKSSRLTTRTVRRLFVPIFGDLSIEKTVHGFRHFFTTEIVKRYDIRTTQKMTRHKSPAMVMVYDDEVLVSKNVGEIHATCFKSVVG